MAILVATGQGQNPRTGANRTWLFFAPSGLAAGALWARSFRALKLGPASRVAPINKLSVVILALFTVLFLGEKLSGSSWLDVALIGCDAIVVDYKGSADATPVMKGNPMEALFANRSDADLAKIDRQISGILRISPGCSGLRYLSGRPCSRKRRAA